MNIKTVLLAIILIFCATIFAATHNQTLQPEQATNQNYVTINAADYQKTVATARNKIKQILKQLPRQKTLDAQIAFLAKQFADQPYLFSGAIGEGDWVAGSSVYRPHALHIQQDPVYRTDGFNCQTFVQVVLAALRSHDLAQFDQTIVKIAYGAAGTPANDRVRYYNRNNFPEGDFNPVNEKNGVFHDALAQGTLARVRGTLTENITRQNWFIFQQKNSSPAVRVLQNAHGPTMAKRFSTFYSHLPFPDFTTQTITLDYLPKAAFAFKQPDGGYLPNTAVLDAIPTPAVIEVVRDPRKWLINDKLIKDVIGSELAVSHLGLLYRQTFKHGELIYQKIICNKNNLQQKICSVTPVTCQQQSCRELMLAHATEAYPSTYFWYQQADGNYVCSPQKPGQGKYTQCDRVEKIPLFDYLTTPQYRFYVYLNNPAILGIHLETIN